MTSSREGFAPRFLDIITQNEDELLRLGGAGGALSDSVNTMPNALEPANWPPYHRGIRLVGISSGYRL